MFTAVVLAALAPILGTGTIAQAVAFLGTPAGRVAKKVLMEILKSAGKPLTPEQQVRLARTKYADRFAMTKNQYWNYIENGVKTQDMLNWERMMAKRRGK
jgi:hypothetical protein